jgi:hypothetical protein
MKAVSRLMHRPMVDGSLSLSLAILSMYAVVVFVVAAADETLWAVPAAACLAIAAYACTRLYNLLFSRR